MNPFGRSPFGRSPFDRRGGIHRPTSWEGVLAWYKGLIDADIYLRDSAQPLGDYLLQMVDGPCLSPDGVDTFTTVTDHGTIVSYEGTSALVYDGDTVTATAGTFYNLLFSDGTFYPCIGKTNTLNPTSTFATNGSELVIVSLDYVAIWAGVQQTYFWEVANGYAERENFHELSTGPFNVFPWRFNNETGNAIVNGNDITLYEDGVNPADNIRLTPMTYVFTGGVRYVLGIDAELITGGALHFRAHLSSTGEDGDGWGCFPVSGEMNWYSFTPTVDQILSLTQFYKFNSPDNTNPLNFKINRITINTDIEPTDHGTINIIGDSICDGAVSYFTQVYVTSTVINSAVAGEELVEMAARFTADVINTNPDHIILWGGVNDLIAASGGADPVPSMKAAVIEMAGKCSVASVPFTIANIQPLEGYTNWNTILQGRLEEYNLWSEEYAAANGIEYIDMYSYMGDEDNPQALELSAANPDLLHLGQNGSEIAAVKLGEHLVREYPTEFITTEANPIEGRQPTPADVPAGWNYPMNGFKYEDPVPQAVIDADPDNVWVDIGGLANTLTQEEIEANAFVNVNGQDWFTPLRGTIKDTTPLTGVDFTNRETWMGL